MNTSRIAPGDMVARLAVAALLIMGNFVRAAEEGAGIAVRRAMHAAASDADRPIAIGHGPNFATSFPDHERALIWGYHPSGLLIFVNPALTRAPDQMPNPGEKASPAARNKASGHGRRTLVTDAQEATEAARNEADLNALFAVAVRVKPARVEAAKNAQGERGKRVYLDLCYACHQPDGRGLPGTFPTLAKSDYMAADRTRAIRVVLEGLAGPVTVNGETISSVMPAQKAVLTDEQIADVLTYAFNSWENPGGEFTASQVAAVRNEKFLD